jgi:signal transduction histidine kinase
MASLSLGDACYSDDGGYIVGRGPLLSEFISSNRDEIIERTRARAASRPSPKATLVELNNGIPKFLDQLSAALMREGSGGEVDHDRIRKTAKRHGHDLLRMGMTVGQVVRDYGDVCQVVTDLAVEQAAPIGREEFRTLNLCLDDAIAEAVTEFSRRSELAVADQETERLGVLAHELRNLVSTAMLTFDSIKSGRVAVNGSTSMLHGRTLNGLRALIDRSLADVRLDAGIQRLEDISVDEFVAQLEIGALLQAEERQIELVIGPVEPDVSVNGDRQILTAAVSNLIHNALKFSPMQSRISLTTVATADRVTFEVEDGCGGILPEKTAALFRPFNKLDRERRGIGLGLSIVLKAAKAHAGEIRVRNLPGKGCIFTLDLPRNQSSQAPV